ncbi:MAG: C-GCAxxG-C-C family protein [Kiritimatiellae bacterium]|nr:C-GCAxxG-C-C family protein [Kiritimatiellia bacterium]
MEKSDKAVELFKTGACCSQAVFCAFAEDFGMDAETAMKVSAGLGGGVGRMREVCGAVTGATLALGMKYGPDKAAVYPHVQELCARFKAECGSIVCRELLAGSGATQGGAPEARTDAYYRKRPCAEMVRLAAELAAQV